MGCGNEISDWDDKAVQDSLAGKNTELDPKILKEVMPAVREAIERRIGELARERIDERIEKGPNIEPEKGLTPERVESLFTKVFNEQPQKIRDAIYGHLHFDEEGPIRITEEGELRKTSAALVPARERERKLEEEGFNIKLPDRRDASKDIVVTFKVKSLEEARGFLYHEVAHADYKLMSYERQQQLEKMWSTESTADKNRELEFFKRELYGARAGMRNPHVVKDSKENYCFWMTAFSPECESRERLRELKEINPDKFNFIAERCRANERERLLELIKEEGFVH